MFARIKNAWTRFRSRQIVLELVVSVCLACLVWLYLHNRARNATELDGRTIQANPALMQFRLKAAPKQKIYDLVDVPIHFLFPKDSPWRARFGNDKESKVTLKLVGPATDQTPPVLAFVDLTRGNLARGRNLEPLRLQLPKDFQLAQPATALVTFYLDELERQTATSRKGD